MNFLKKKTILAGLLIALMSVDTGAQSKETRENPGRDKSMLHEVMLFGGTGTIGDGILKALLADPAVRVIHVVTRRETARITGGVAAGKVKVAKHMNYLDYAPLTKLLKRTPTVYWALGTSAGNVNDKKYTEIHVDFPVAFVKYWMSVNKNGGKSFHLVTGAGTGADSWFHWAREKAKAEKALFALAKKGGPRVVAYRPSFILPAKERAGWFRSFFSSLFGAIRTTHIGQGMLEISMRPREVPSGSIIEHGRIKHFAKVYRERVGPVK